MLAHRLPIRITLPLLLLALGAIAHTTVAAGPAPKKLRIVLVGDSTVTDEAGWGKAFAELVGDRAECINTARGGRSSKSFYDEGHWKRALETKPDYVLIQFGHNDQPGKGPKRETDPATTYRDNLNRYVREARDAGAQPILVTSLCRRIFTPEGKIRPDLEPYVEAARAVAKAADVPCVDLYAASVAQAEGLGPAGALSLGPPHPELKDKVDGTHLSAAGAKQVAPLVAQGVAAAVPALRDVVSVPAQP